MPARVPMSERQRQALLALPDTEDEVVRHHSLDAADLAAVAGARTPETRLSYALQLCCLRYPGRNLRRGEVLPAVMLDHIAEQIGVDAAVIAGFARRGPTRYEQLDSIKRRHGFRDLTQPDRAELAFWLSTQAIGLSDGRVLLDRLISKLRREKIVIPGVSVVERMAAEAMHAADLKVIAEVDALLTREQRSSLDAILSEKAHARQSRLAWLREPSSRTGGRSLLDILDKLDLIRATGAPGLQLPEAFHPRLAQMAREGVRQTAQAFQQMGPARRYAGLVATLRDLEATLTDAALDMFRSLVARANLRARKRLEDTVAASAESGRERLLRIADVLDALTKAAKSGRDIAGAVTAVALLDVIEADAALLRRMTRPGRPDALELGPEYKVFKQVGCRFLASLAFEGRASTAPLRSACAALAALGGDWRRPLPADLPLGHIERRWRRHVFGQGGVDRTYWELATYFALSDALASGDIWVPTSRLHRSLDVLLTPATSALARSPARLPAVAEVTADEWIGAAAAELDAALIGLARDLSGKEARLFAGDKLRFPKEPKADGITDGAKQLALRSYGFVPPTRITDVLSQINHWTGFVGHFGHVSSGLPPDDERAFLAALIAEATNLGLSRMAEVCGAASRRALLRMQTWHMREETFRAGLACVTDAIHAEPLSAWFGDGVRASADGQAFYLGGPGEAGGKVNAHYGRDPIVKIYTTITDRYAPLHQTVIAGTAGEAIHALDGILGHDSEVDVSALHVDGGGVSDIVFAVMHLLGLDFEPRIPRLSDRRLYAFEPRSRYGRLTPLFGQRLDTDLIRAHWDDIGRVMTAMRDRTVTPCFHDRGHENQQTRAAALNLVTAAIILFNCRYLGRALSEMRSRGMTIDEGLIPQLSPLGWDHINLTGDYVWSDALVLDADGCMPLRLPAA